MAVVKDLSGQRFGRLVAIECAGRTNNGNATWLCKCDCGSEKVVSSYNLRAGRTKSCGCISDERYEALRSMPHRRSRLYRIWTGIKTRCFNTHHEDSYRKYGGKGITMCDEWRNSYDAFREWAITHGYDDALTIDRIDPKGMYCPENCRWANQVEQQNNRSNNHRITYNGETHTIAEWSRILGWSRSVIPHRLERGWPIEKAMTMPPRLRRCES